MTMKICSAQLDFATYTAWMGLPTLCAGFTLFGTVSLYFWRSFFSSTSLKRVRSLDNVWEHEAVPLPGGLGYLCPLFSCFFQGLLSLFVR
jgi:hypothetical protein